MIPGHRIKANGKVDLWEKPGEGDEFEPRQVEMAPVDAAHALTVGADRWSLTEPVVKEEKQEEKQEEKHDDE